MIHFPALMYSLMLFPMPSSGMQPITKPHWKRVDGRRKGSWELAAAFPPSRFMCCKAAGVWQFAHPVSWDRRNFCFNADVRNALTLGSCAPREKSWRIIHILTQFPRAWKGNKHLIAGLWANSCLWNQHVGVYLTRLPELEVFAFYFFFMPSLKAAEWKHRFVDDFEAPPVHRSQRGFWSWRHETVCHLRISAIKSKQQLITALLQLKLQLCFHI